MPHASPLIPRLGWIALLVIRLPLVPLAHAQQSETVYEVTSPLWYEDAARFYRVAPDGRRAQYGSGTLARFIDLEHRIELKPASPDTLPLPGDSRYRLVAGADGLSTLTHSGDGKSDTVRGGLDGAWSVNFVAASPEGVLYLALASDSIPQPSARHIPDADRDLDIYSLDPKTGELRLVARAPNDDCCPVIANGYLYWTHSEPASEIVRTPIAAGRVPLGAARVIVRGGFLPRISPDGRQVAYTKGSFRLADYGLDMDEWVVSLDSTGRASAPRPLVVGYGEDMGATWSPDGKWLAFHSHRAKTPFPMYDSPEHTDDIWIRRADQPAGEEIRLTDFGWEVSPPDWAPDSRHLLFESWEKGGNPAIAKPWIVTIDPATGRAAGLDRVPLPAGVQGTKFEAWSPKAQEVALVQRIDGGHQAVWVTGVDGKNARRVIDYPSFTYGGVTWTPDGTEIWYAAIAESRMQIFAVPAAGGPPRQVTHDAANMMHPALSRDGKWLVATRVLWRKQLRRKRVA